MQSKIILISGPTASGKSKLAIDIAKKFKGEIVNADSMQVYKEIKILSARPISFKNIKHHLYGFVSVKKKFSTGHWIKLVKKKIKEIQKNKKIPIIVGGTGLYFKSLVHGMVSIPKISNRIRNKILYTLKNQHGIKCMLKLECCDLESGTAIDHMIPISSNKLNKELRNLKAEKGRKVKTQSFGSNHIDNLIIACNNCNNRKKHRMLNHDIIMYILKEKRTATNNV